MPAPDRIVRLKTVLARTGLSRSTIYRKIAEGTFPAQLRISDPWPFPGRPPKHDLSTWTVTDDWPHPVPVTQAEIEVFEQWFGDIFDELFGSEG